MQTAWENLSDPIFHYAESRPGAEALNEGGRTLSYRELADRIAKASVLARDLGVKPGDLVAVAMPGSIDHIVLTFGLMRAGAIPIDMPARPPKGAIVNPLKLFEIGRVFREGSGLPAPPGTIVHEVNAAFLTELQSKRGDHREVRDADEVHNFSMTSGSTGLPRGVLTTRRQWLARFDTGMKLFPDVLDPDHPPRLLVIGGLAFSAFFFFLANQLFIGGPVVLMTENPDPELLRGQIDSWDDAVSLITPPLARKFLTMSSEGGPMFPKLRALFIGASPLYPEEKLAVAEKLTPNFREVYGSAACGFISSLSPGEIAAHAESVGRPAPGLEMQAVDAERKAVPAGAFGHLRCRGPGISKGFHGESALSPEKPEGFRDGWYYPGDIGGFDADGYILLKGRLADVIYRRGVEILPLELEQIIAGHESVAEVAVVGIKAKNETGTDQKVIGFVVPRSEPQKAALAQYCRANIPAEKFPDRVFFVKGLPKNANGKLDRMKLQSFASREAEKQIDGAGGETKAARMVMGQLERDARARETPLRFGSGGPDAGAVQTIAAIEAHLTALTDELLLKPQPNTTLSRRTRIARRRRRGSERELPLHGYSRFLRAGAAGG